MANTYLTPRRGVILDDSPDRVAVLAPSRLLHNVCPDRQSTHGLCWLCPPLSVIVCAHQYAVLV